MENKQEQIPINKNNGTGCAIVLFIFFLIIFVPILIGLVSNNIEKSNQAKHEARLIEEGKVKTHDEVMNEIIEILKSRKEEDLKKYLTEDFVYINNDSYESKYISGFWNDLKYFTGKYYLEKRGNSIKDEETYWIYWDIPKELTYEQYSQYSLQRIFVYLKRTVKENVITYKINKIILRDN